MLFFCIFVGKNTKRTKKYNNSNMEYLSMGMSNDYEIAAEEGANVLRVGRAVFAAE